MTLAKENSGTVFLPIVKIATIKGAHVDSCTWGSHKQQLCNSTRSRIRTHHHSSRPCTAFHRCKRPQSSRPRPKALHASQSVLKGDFTAQQTVQQEAHSRNDDDRRKPTNCNGRHWTGYVGRTEAFTCSCAVCLQRQTQAIMVDVFCTCSERCGRSPGRHTDCVPLALRYIARPLCA